MSFFSRFHKAGTTAITQQDIKVKTVKVPSTPTTPHPLPIIAHQRPATPRTPSFNIAPSATTSTKPKSSSKSGLLSPPATGDRGRDSKIGRDRSTSRADISRDRSLKRKESSSSFQRNDSPSTTTSSLRSVSPSTDSVTSHPKKRKLTPSATHRNSPIQEKLFSSDDESESGSDDEASEGSKEEKLRRLREAEELGLTKRDRGIYWSSVVFLKNFSSPWSKPILYITWTLYYLGNNRFIIQVVVQEVLIS
ncbi:hypothetical protein BDZ91DRAFT_721948 [Kalaharituber pfeilii]|nr:hypothetical protein BDZ91DRAFT_721948 [Kalaharituber pfeilii]